MVVGRQTLFAVGCRKYQYSIRIKIHFYICNEHKCTGEQDLGLELNSLKAAPGAAPSVAVHGMLENHRSLGLAAKERKHGKKTYDIFYKNKVLNTCVKCACF